MAVRINAHLRRQVLRNPGPRAGVFFLPQCRKRKGRAPGPAFRIAKSAPYVVGRMMISTRRFWARPSGVRFDATG